MKKKIVIALGGNALGNNLKEQYQATRNISKTIVDLIQDGNEVVVSHGNGPQVGMIDNAMSLYSSQNPDVGEIHMSVCVAMSQGYIGGDLQSCIREELLNRGISKPVTTIITQVTVDANDSAFDNPTKPIGSFLSEEEAKELSAKGIAVMEDSGRGYRRVVPSPKPVGIVEIDAVQDLIDKGHVVVACGGGGIPVIEEGNHLKPVNAVIDKDLASSCMARLLDADYLVILTAVEKVAINFGKPEQKWLTQISVDEANQYREEGHFAPGSMLPKIEAAIDFSSSQQGRVSLITLLEKAAQGIRGETGTRIV